MGERKKFPMKVSVLTSGLVLLFSFSSPGFANSQGLAEAAKSNDIKTVRALVAKHVDVNAPASDGTTALAWAVYRNNLETAALLIRAGANVNAANELGATPLYLACQNGNFAMVEALVAAGANTNVALPSGETVLMTASRTGNHDAVRLLLGHDAQVNAKETRRGQTALMWAVAEGHRQIVKLLIDHGADLNAHSKTGFTPLMFAAQEGDLETAKLLSSAGAKINEIAPEDGSALVVAAMSGHQEFAEYLLDKGADPNASNRIGVTALDYAIMKGLALATGVQWFASASELYRPNQPELVKALLAHGANPNARILERPPLPGVRNLVVVSVAGATPLMLAAASYDVEIMRILVAAGADPHLVTKEQTNVLLFASGLAEGLGKPPLRTDEDDRHALEAVKFAVELGIDVNTRNKHDVTPLHGAAYVGSDAIVKFLVDNGARMEVKDDSGQTALSIAEQIFPSTLLDDNLRPATVHQSTADLLVKLGAPPFVIEPASPN
jgi:ankyrin repeat protein